MFFITILLTKSKYLQSKGWSVIAIITLVRACYVQFQSVIINIKVNWVYHNDKLIGNLRYLRFRVKPVKTK